MTVIVDIALAVICFSATPDGPQECHHALIGSDTPRGEFVLQQRLVDSPLYGGDILQFDDQPDGVAAIHRVWLGRPWEKREERLKSNRVRDRKITKGCVNVAPEVYEKLLDCCSTSKLLVK